MMSCMVLQTAGRSELCGAASVVCVCVCTCASMNYRQCRRVSIFFIAWHDRCMKETCTWIPSSWCRASHTLECSVAALSTRASALLYMAECALKKLLYIRMDREGMQRTSLKNIGIRSWSHVSCPSHTLCTIFHDNFHFMGQSLRLDCRVALRGDRLAGNVHLPLAP
jgi:hypothetical protein